MGPQLYFFYELCMGVKPFESDWAVREYSMSGKLGFHPRWPRGSPTELYERVEATLWVDPLSRSRAQELGLISFTSIVEIDETYFPKMNPFWRPIDIIKAHNYKLPGSMHRCSKTISQVPSHVRNRWQMQTSLKGWTHIVNSEDTTRWVTILLSLT